MSLPATPPRCGNGTRPVVERASITSDELEVARSELRTTSERLASAVAKRTTAEGEAAVSVRLEELDFLLDAVAGGLRANLYLLRELKSVIAVSGQDVERIEREELGVLRAMVKIGRLGVSVYERAVSGND